MSDTNTAAIKQAKTRRRRYKAEKEPEIKVKVTRKELKRQRELVWLSVPFIIYGIIFYYAPIFGWIMAFQNFKPAKGLLGSDWVGLRHFERLFSNNAFLLTVRNTIAMGVINLVLSFFFAIMFAVLLNEVRLKAPKKIAQTISYLPHFLSWIIVCGIVRDMLSMDSGIVNDLLVRVGILEKPISFFSNKDYFWWIVGFSNVWKETGWNSIIYLAAITSINPELYEAAALDGAGRLRKMWHITLPGIKPTIFILLIINIGNVLNQGFEVQYLLGNDLIREVSQTIDIFILRDSISQADYSLGTAAGIFKSVASIVLIMLANLGSRISGEESLF